MDDNNEILEIIFSGSLFISLNELKNEENIVLIKAQFNLADLTSIHDDILIVPKKFPQNKESNNISKEKRLIKTAIDSGRKIRIWTSHTDIYSYLGLLYVCSLIGDEQCELYVTFSDELNSKFHFPGCLMTKELEQLEQLEHRLTKEEIKNYSLLWENVVKNNSQMRVIKDGKILNVNYDYYDSKIMETLQIIGKCRKIDLIVGLEKNIYVNDSLLIVLIDELINARKISIIEKASNHLYDIISL